MSHERDPIDPDRRFPSEYRRAFEEHTLALLPALGSHALTRTRDAIEIRYPEGAEADDQLVLLATPEALELRLPDIEWTRGSYGPAASSTLWRRIPWPEPTARDLTALAEAHQARKRPCRHCHRRFVPARMTGSACHACASRFDGVVY